LALLKYTNRRWIIWVLIMLGMTIAGCDNQGAQLSVVSLVRVNDRSISVDEFNSRFDAVSAEFPLPAQADPAVDKEMKLRLLHQLTEELILLERAEELNLEISDQDLTSAIDRIRADYPEGEFEKVLLEQAISYSLWKAQLRVRLLKEKVVREDLEISIVLTPAEISAAYESHYSPSDTAGHERLNDADIDEKVVKFVRQQKAQQFYQAWLKDLQSMYDVDINAAAWEKMNGS